MTVIVEQDPVLVASFQAALGGGSTVLDSLDQLEDHLQRHPAEFTIVLGVSVSIDGAAAFAQRARIQRPTLGVILVRTRIDSTVLAEALRAGMREVVESRDMTGLSDAVRRAHAVWQAMSDSAGRVDEPASSQGVMFTVFATKGGVGKTLVATNLGVALADQGNRVCVVDLDMLNGDVAIMMQVSPTRSLADLASIAGVPDRGGVDSLLTEHSEGLWVLAAPVQVEARDHVSADSVGVLLQLLKGMFDVVVVDTSGAFDDYALNAFDRSDLLVLVGTLDIPALKSLKLATGTLDLLAFPRERWRLILNRADAKVGLTTRQFEETLGFEAKVTLPSSREVLAAVNRGEAIVRAQPGNVVSKTFKSLAKSLMEDTVDTSTDVPAEAPRAAGNRRGLSRRRTKSK